MRTPISNLGSPLQKLGAPPGGAAKDDLKKVDSKVNSLESEGESPPLFEDVLESRNEPQPKEVASSGAKEKAPVGFESPSVEEVAVKIPVEKKTEIPIVKPVKQETVQGSKAETQEKAQVLMLDFMDSMESELGIAPAEIVVAMSRLNNQDLMLPPEETVEQVIGQFDLDAGEEVIAIDLYGDLLVGLAALKAEPQSTAEAFADRTWAGGAWSDPQMMGRAGAATAGMMMLHQQPQTNQLSQNTLSQRLPGQQISVQQPLTPKEKKEALNASLDKMNSKFFMQEPKAMPQDLAGSQDLANESLKTSMRDPKLMSETSAGRNYSGGKMNLPEGMQVVELETVSHQSADADPAMLDAQVMDSAMKPEAKLIATTAGLAAQAMKAMPKAEVRSAEAMSVDTAQMQVGMNADVMPMNVLSKANAQSSNNDLMSFSDKGSSLEDSDLKSLSDPSSSKEGDPFAVSKDAGQVDPLRGNAKSLAAGGAAGAMLGARHGQNDPNVQALMNRAQILIRDGGGEMKVTMTPEGMGTVDLKVVVENGKVNVEMLADSPHAKKLIESASNDLKSHLIESKLDVGAIKVDLASRSSTNLDNSSGQQQQKQMDSQPDHRGREQAQQFFNQFREGNLSQRGGMTEMPDFRSYSPRKSVALEPAKRPDPTARKNEGGRISLVA